MQLWKRLTELLITKKLNLGPNAVMQVNGVDVDLTAMAALDGLDETEVGYLDGTTAGTVTASKAVVVDANKDIGDFRDLTAAYLYGVPVPAQGAPHAATVSATLTAANILTGIITVNQGAAGASAQQLPLAADMDTALPRFAAGDSFDFSVINISTVDAEDASITTNTGWTLVGSMDVPAYSAAGSLNSSARFRARKTGTAAWTLYRIS